MKEILLTLVTAVAAYLLGCISTGTIVSRRQGVNIRNEGSHNTGASNVLRVLGLKDGLITFLGDFAKAALACLIGNLLVPSAFGIEGLGRIVAALFVVIGHNWPVFYHFQGGKGVACSTAVVLLMSWGMVFLTGTQTGIAEISRRSWLFLVLSGLATGASWLCYYHALQIGAASKVVPIDKLSVVITLALAFVVLHEPFTAKSLIGCALITAGTLFMVL